MLKIRLKNYGTWFFSNFVLCSLPFIVMIFLGYSSKDIYSGFLTFNYTLIISSVYLLLQVLNQKNINPGIPIFLLLISIFWALIIIVLYSLYPKFLSGNILILFKGSNLLLNYLIVIFVTIIISFFLNKPYIEDNIQFLINNEKYNKAKKEKKVTDSYKDRLEKEGI